MRYRLRTLLIAAALGPPLLAVVVILPELNTTNCGGNTAARGDVDMYLGMVQVAAMESPNQEFAIASATVEQRNELAHIANDFWLKGAGFLVSTKPYRWKSSEPRRVVIVCDRAFTNVPRHVFGRAPPTHAAGFSDRSTALLSEKEFAALDRTSFVPLREILAQ